MPSPAEEYKAKVDRVLAQRTRLRGPEPAGGLFGGLAADHPLMKAEARQPLSPNVQVIAGFIEAGDTIVDVGGGSGRYSLPLALRCRELINVDPSAAMGAGFLANAAREDIKNVRFLCSDWESTEPPQGTVALVNHVTYLTRSIVPFIEKLNLAGRRRVIMTVNTPPPPYRQSRLFQMVHDEPEERVPGHEALMNVLWEMGMLPDLQMLPSTTSRLAARPSREAAIAAAVANFRSEQWSLWPYEPALEERVRAVIEAHFDELFSPDEDGFNPTWPAYGREVLMTWCP